MTSYLSRSPRALSSPRRWGEGQDEWFYANSTKPGQGLSRKGPTSIWRSHPYYSLYEGVERIYAVRFVWLSVCISGSTDLSHHARDLLRSSGHFVGHLSLVVCEPTTSFSSQKRRKLTRTMVRRLYNPPSNRQDCVFVGDEPPNGITSLRKTSWGSFIKTLEPL